LTEPATGGYPSLREGRHSFREGSLNKVIKTKASAEATPPGTTDPPDSDEDTAAATEADVTEPKTDGEVLKEIQDRPHPFN
jgi:hypothetical protein